MKLERNKVFVAVNVNANEVKDDTRFRADFGRPRGEVINGYVFELDGYTGEIAGGEWDDSCLPGDNRILKFSGYWATVACDSDLTFTDRIRFEYGPNTDMLWIEDQEIYVVWDGTTSSIFKLNESVHVSLDRYFSSSVIGAAHSSGNILTWSSHEAYMSDLTGTEVWQVEFPGTILTGTVTEDGALLSVSFDRDQPEFGYIHEGRKNSTLIWVGLNGQVVASRGFGSVQVT